MPTSAHDARRLAECFASCQDQELTIGNSVMTRRYRITPEGLVPVSLVFGGKEWLAGAEGDTASATLSAGIRFKTVARPLLDTGVKALTAELELDAPTGLVCWRLSVAPGLGAVTVAVERETSKTGQGDAFAGGGEPTGRERDPVPGDAASAAPKPRETGWCERFRAASPHLVLREYRFADQTDCHDNLLQIREYRLATVEPVRLRGGLFAVENPLTRAGVILLKLAPLPERRPVPDAVDFAWDGKACAFLGDRYPWAVLGYEGGEPGATAALHRYQQAVRPQGAGRDGLALSNTWGDRNRDNALCETFLLGEIAVAADLGLDVCQIDDGWQAGMTVNSGKAQETGGGLWEGYHGSGMDFWAVHPERFPNGLEPLAKRCEALGVGLGLWFSPDSSDDFAHWEKDVETVLGLERSFGVRWIKIDGVKSRTRRGEANLARFFRSVRERSGGRIVFDLDVTAEIRPGYFGLPNHGPLFVENRYTDWRRYWPYATFRNTWQLSRAVLPARLRMECLNPERNADKYGDDPLAPIHYGMDWAFASVMVTSPLVWCELSSLSEPARAALRRIVGLWKIHRDELHAGVAYPIGPCPDGSTTSGFFTVAPSACHLILLRDLDGVAARDWALPAEVNGGKMEIVAGGGDCRRSGDNRVRCTLPEVRSYLWVRFSRG